MKRVLALLVGVSVVMGCTVASAPSSPPSAEAPTPGSFVPVVTPSADPTPLPSPTTAPPSPAPGLLFEQVATVEGTELYTAVSFAGGYLVGGCRLRPPSGASGGGCAEARILYSTDGRSWLDAVVVGAAERRVIGISETPLGLLAFGSNQAPEPPLTRSVWRSADGIRWEPFVVPAPESIVFNRAFVLAGRTVLIGEDSAYDFSVETEAWATTEGGSWTKGTTPMSTKVAAHPGIVAIGDECVDLCPSNLPIYVRRSLDGLAWTEDAPDPALAEAQVFASGSWAGRAVAGGAVGEGPDGEAAVWFDEPGGWHRVRLDGGRGFGVQGLLDGGAQLIAVGRADADGASRAWWTTDGLTWTSGVLDGIGDGYPGAWAGHGPLVVVVDFRSIWLSAY